MSSSLTQIKANIVAKVPDNYDWSSTRRIRQPDSTHTTANTVLTEEEKLDSVEEKASQDEKKSANVSVVPHGSAQDVVEAEQSRPTISADAERTYLQRVFVNAAWISLTMTLIITFVS